MSDVTQKAGFIATKPPRSQEMQEIQFNTSLNKGSLWNL
jgi:hypothetical protein